MFDAGAWSSAHGDHEHHYVGDPALPASSSSPKIPSPDPYGRIGNQAGSDESAVVLGDYKADPDAELERPERVSLIDTATNTLRLVDLGVSYTFRSLARGPQVRRWCSAPTARSTSSIR